MNEYTHELINQPQGIEDLLTEYILAVQISICPPPKGTWVEGLLFHASMSKAELGLQR